MNHKIPKKLLIKAWAVMNTEGNYPCVELDRDDFIIASAIYSDEDGDGKQQCLDYIKRSGFSKEAMKRLGIKVVPCVISYSLKK